MNGLSPRDKANACFFADDCLLYRIIETYEDAESLQDDLNKLQHWEADRLLKFFNPYKCKLIRMINKHKTNCRSTSRPPPPSRVPVSFSPALSVEFTTDKINEVNGT